MRIRSSSFIRLTSGLVAVLALGCGPAAAQSCATAVEAAKAEWRSLTKGNHSVAPSLRISTSDGRQLTGSQLNYAWVLIDRAQGACGSGDATAVSASLREIDALLHPAPRI